MKAKGATSKTSKKTKIVKMDKDAREMLMEAKAMKKAHMARHKGLVKK